jgi:DNA (cytosine-5)-methyltransferase 1
LNNKKGTKKELKAVDFFCGAGGMTNGFINAGIKVLAGIDLDITCKETYEENNKVKFIHSDVNELSVQELQEKTEIEKDDDELVLIGCSPCQYWSKIKSDKTKSAESKNLLLVFMKFIGKLNPGYIVVENVPGILSNKTESPLQEFLGFLQKSGYHFDYSIINTALIGVPQKRKRFVLLASRLGPITISFNKNCKTTTVRETIGDLSEFPHLEAGDKLHDSNLDWTAKLSTKNIGRLKATPPDGGLRVNYAFDDALVIPSHFRNQSSFRDSYGRMHWDRPSPTITTKFISLSNGRFGHPDQNRALSLKEGARLQTFPLEYRFYSSSLTVIARHIGNAVPPKLSKFIADIILENAETKSTGGSNSKNS